MILVVGANGFLGRETVRQLLAAGQRVRAAARVPDTVADLKQAGAEVVHADLIDPASLASACNGIDVVFAAAHSLMGVRKYASHLVDGAGHRALIDAAKAAGVKRFVYTSVHGASPEHRIDFFRTKAGVEDYLARSGLGFTILRPTAFMEWHVHLLLGKSIVDSGKTTIFGSGNNPTNFIAAFDVARFAVLALTEPQTSGKTLEIGGPDNITKRQVVQMYERVLGRSAIVRSVPVAAMRIMAPLVRPFHPVLSRLMEAAIFSDTTDQTFDVSDIPPQYRGPMTPVEDFIRVRAGAAQMSTT
jgi:NADH dehydrogenase